MGIILDLLTQGSGAHTIAQLTIAFVRPTIIKLLLVSTMIFQWE